MITAATTEATVVMTGPTRLTPGAEGLADAVPELTGAVREVVMQDLSTDPAEALSSEDPNWNGSLS
jgi:hypothetical protein